MLNTSTIGYKGLVEVKYIINGKEISIKGHNAGKNAMFKFICKTLTGETNTVGRDRPTYLDVVCRYSDPTEGIVDTSCIYNLISLSKPDYFFDTSIIESGSWVTRFNITLSHNMINDNVLEAHPGSNIILILKSQAGEAFAEYELDTTKISLGDIVPGTQALVQWTMLFQNI